MRKIIGICVCLCLAIFSAGTWAEEGAPQNQYYALTLTGRVVAGETALVTAPYGGRVAPFGIREGDIIAADEPLFVLEPTEVYAPCEGVVVGIRPEVGDDAAFLQERYGALMYLEPANPFLIHTTTRNAYNASENLNIRIGEMVYIESRVYYNKSGVGYVTAVDGENYTVEVIGGNLVLHDDVAIYREPDFVNHSKIGNGKIDRNTAVPITAGGSVLSIKVAEGDRVRRGDVLMEMVEGTLSGNLRGNKEINSGVDGIVATIEVKPGARVEQRQVMATVYPTRGLQVAAEVHELDIGGIHAGDGVRVDFPGIKPTEPFMGRIESIGALSTSESGDAQYLVYVSFDTDERVRMGMSATIFVNQ
ncbi:MAG: HlyD family efflux transporter periplasmic adaptor subunit [Clostridia bacterium]|nr:HlyD family efflux transporter periplasmic adaptor subunit [Clostridia bacterium]